MENLINPTKVATKWALIYLITSIVITYAFQFSNIDQTSPLRYLAYIPFIAFLLLAQKEYKDQLGGFITFNNGFSVGFRYAVFAGLLMAVFIYIYLTFLSPEVLEKSLAESRTQMEAKGTSNADIEKGLDVGRKYGAIIGAFVGAIGITIFGTIVALVGAAIFKKERTALDLENDTLIDPAV